MSETTINNVRPFQTSIKDVVTKKHTEPPQWMSLQNLFTLVTLLGFIVGFFVQNAIWQERLDRLRTDFEKERQETKETLKEININFQVIQNQLSRLQGRREIEEKK
jgi:hypothetical protein